MEEALQKIRTWASHGTMRQFYTEISAKLADTEYQVELDGDTVRCFRVRKEGGFLGIGARKIKDVLLELTRTEDTVKVDEEHMDPAFVEMLGGLLRQH